MAGAAALLSLALAALVGASGRAGETKKEDLVAAEIERWSAFLAHHTTADENWAQVKQATEPALAGAAEALRAGWRLFALQRLAAARANLAASAYLDARSAEQRKDTAGFAARSGESSFCACAGCARSIAAASRNAAPRTKRHPVGLELSKG